MGEHKQNILLQDVTRSDAKQIAYLKKVCTDDLAKNFPDLPPMTPGITIWALFGETGYPIILSDERSVALAGANEHEIQIVTLH
ncbi:BQ00720 family protein [Bartonella sp. B30(2025)]